MLEFFGDLEKYYFGNRPLSLKCKKSSVLRSQNIFSYLILRYYRDLVMLFFFFISPAIFLQCFADFATSSILQGGS